MFNLRLCSAATIQYSLFLLKFGHMHLCGIDYKCFWLHCCKCNSCGCITAIRCDHTCHGPHSDSIYSGSEQNQLDSPRLVKREAGFPNPRRALISSNQLWRVNDSPYCREYQRKWIMMTSSNENIFRVSGPLSGEFTGNQWLILYSERFPRSHLACGRQYDPDTVRVSGPWNPPPQKKTHTKAIDAELWCFPWPAAE